MIDERMFNLLRDQLSTAQAEKGALYAQITSLTAEIRMLRDENKRYRTEDKSSNQQLQTTLSSVRAQLEAALKTIDLLNKELAKERDRNANNNRKNYGLTSEQARLLNNRNVDERSQEKADYDGDSVEKANDDTSTETPSKETKKEKRLRGKKNKSEDKFVNETVMHKLADYHTLSEGGHYLTRKGEILRNFILDGEAEISNNLVEQRMKPIKLDLKNSQNIGSEDAAKRHAFMHSIIESCSMNKITPYGYLVNLFQRYRTLTEEEKLALMPCYYKNNLKN